MKSIFKPNIIPTGIQTFRPLFQRRKETTTVTRSQYSHEGVLSFYLSRLEACKEYGAASGDEMNMTVLRCAFHDSFLTDSEYAIILNKGWDQHKHFMEDMRNEGFWGKRFDK